MDQEEAEKNNKDYTPVFDGRQKFYEVMKQWLVTFGQAQQTNDPGNIIRCLEGMLFMTIPYIKDSAGDSLAKQIRTARNLYILSKNNPGLQYKLEDTLFELKKDFFKSTKKLWLPLAADDDSELNMDAFFKESDL